ncbi:hypothetical protein ACH5RR_023329 [Cinchona calisaya]|uniref:Uncharacterized protein n=1 Tax=Cinchona calisaya TaxID=153742 RepID=A0ABD2ZDH5_9GENT
MDSTVSQRLPMIDQAFAKLVVDLDYPISKWEAATSEAYLKYSLNKIQIQDLGNNFKVQGIKENEEKLSSDKESIIHEALPGYHAYRRDHTKAEYLEEVREVNDAADELVADIKCVKGDGAAEILSRRLDVIEKALQGIGKQTDCLFSEALAARNKLLNSIRFSHF